MNTKTIKLDINKRLYEKITAKQGDTKSRFLLFHLLDGAVPFSLTGRTVRVYGLKPDNKEIFNDLKIVDANKGHCELELTNQALAIIGDLDLELAIYEGESKLTSIPFTVDVLKSINSTNAIESSNEYKALDEALIKTDKWNKEFEDKSGKLEELYTDRLNGLGSQLDEKVNKIAGKGLSTNDYNDTEKAEVAKVKDKMDATKGQVANPFQDLYIEGFGSLKAKISSMIGYEKNANGWYIRFEDGTQICLRDYTINTGTVGSTNIAMPIPYLAGTVPACSFSILSTSVSSILQSVKNLVIMASNNAYVIYNSTAVTASYTIVITSIGRWK